MTSLKKITHGIVYPCVCALLSSPAMALSPKPFEVANYSPLAQIFGLPSIQTALNTAPSGFEANLQHSTANTYVTHENINEISYFDGEVAITSLSLRWRFKDDAELTLRAPYVDHSKGLWDDFIYDWHEWFGLPQGGRTQDTNDQFAYVYQRNGERLLNFREEAAGIGDIRFGYSQQLHFWEQDWLAQLEVKAPTGNADKLTGSGAWDLSAGVGWEGSVDSPDQRFIPFAGAAVSYLGDSDLNLAPLQKNWALSLRAGGHWRALPYLTLTAQIDSHSGLYHSQLRELSNFSLQLTTGGQITLSDSLVLNIAIAEDLNTTITPDFVAILGMTYGW
ncbi:DUF3187 family protein [Hahella sp. KA22]|uniref:DUF3187 family protein n=1 Tax=Hahella sp. KA22 TaxID=1628392 RepID=UPI000FDE57F5|nr:DUF3187 family protein [Hahella sp. KA22]AZZ90883.1 DUF3187 family protein [Hahella sp. KA22]QAY54253.1 DUF3187 family protein [Hahella sp. KA22]